MQDNYEKLKKILEIMGESLTRKEFTEAFESVVKLVLNSEKKILDKNQERFDEFTKLFEDLAEKLKQGNKDNASNLKKEISTALADLKKKFDDAFQEQQHGMNFIYDKVSALRSGKDADEEKIVSNVLAKIPPPKETDLNPLKNEIEQARLELQAELKNLKEEMKKIPRQRMGMRKVPIIKWEYLTSQVDGVVTSFTLPKDTVRVHGVLSTQFPGQFNSTDFSLSGNTLNLNFTIESGQTLIAIIETLFYA